jgi:hypothetical protein
MDMRSIMTLVENVQALTPEQQSEILNDPRCSRGVKISTSHRFWRGEDEDGGSGFATYGQGLYFTTNRQYAKKYGKVTEISRSMLPDNALRFKTVNDYQIWQQTAMKIMGFNDKREFYAVFPNEDDFIHAIDPTIDGLQIGSSSDAIFVLYSLD